MHVIVVGCGRVGSSLALELERGGHSVSVIDKVESSFRRLGSDFAGTAIVGAGFDRDRLDAAGAGRAGALAAVTSGDNSNILTARIARETYEIPAVVARIYDPRRAEIYQRLGISTVATVTWTMEQAMRKLFPAHTVAEWSDVSGQVHLVERAIPSAWFGRRLSAIEDETGGRLAAVTRSGTTTLASADLVGQQGDLVYLVVDAESRQKLVALFGDSDENVTRVTQ